MKPAVLGMCLAIALSLVLFNNCSKVAFSTAQSSVGVTGGPGATPTPPPPEVIDQIVKNCADAKAAGKLLSQSYEVSFEDTRDESGRSQICDPSTPGNLALNDKYDGYLAARYEQERTLSLPVGAVLCGIELQNDPFTFKFDDMIFLTFNNYVMISSERSQLTSLLNYDTITVSSTKSLNLYKYDWMKLRLASFDNDVSNDYCVGANENLGSCSWPKTQTTGSINLAWDSRLLIAISQMSADKSQQKFKFVVTGDNDPNIDCYHAKLILNSKVSYYLAP